MKKYIVSFLFICSYVNAQIKQPDYSEIKKPEDLRKLCLEKDSEIKKYIDLIDNINNSIFRTIIENKYIKGESYFIETDLSPTNDDDTQRIIVNNILIKSLLITEKDTLFIKKCNTASNFNENYLKLFEIRKNILFKKYDSGK